MMVFTESIYPRRGWSFGLNRGIINPMSLSKLPSINRLLSDDRLAGLPHALAKRAAREVVDEARAAVLDGAEVPLDLADVPTRAPSSCRSGSSGDQRDRNRHSYQPRACRWPPRLSTPSSRRGRVLQP